MLVTLQSILGRGQIILKFHRLTKLGLIGFWLRIGGLINVQASLPRPLQVISVDTARFQELQQSSLKCLLVQHTGQVGWPNGL